MTFLDEISVTPRQEPTEYKWDSPHDWLHEKVNKEWDADKVRQELLFISRAIGADTLQDMYQSDMDRDGYFDEA